MRYLLILRGERCKNPDSRRRNKRKPKVWFEEKGGGREFYSFFSFFSFQL